MIKSAKEAREIISKTQAERDSSWHRIGGSDLFHEAEGYLHCLEHGEEVKALVDALISFGGGAKMRLKEGDEPYLRWMLELSEKALSQYRNSLKPEGK